MRSDIRQAWLNALRSGNYVQGSGKLRRALNENAPDITEGYCCLGVLCDIVRPFGWRPTTYGSHQTHELDDGNGDYLSTTTLRELGITKAQQSQLANLNDKPLTFHDIAGVIEAFIPEEEAA